MHTCQTCGLFFKKKSGLLTHYRLYRDHESRVSKMPATMKNEDAVNDENPCSSSQHKDQRQKPKPERSHLNQMIANIEDYYSIKREYVLRAPKFHTLKTRYDITFKELKVEAVHEFFVLIPILFDSILFALTRHIPEDDLLQLTVECPTSDYPVHVPFTRKKNFHTEMFLSEIEGSDELFVLDQGLKIQVTHVRLPKGWKRGMKIPEEWII